MRNWIAKLALLALFLSGVTLLRAQDSAAMTGTVTDATGALIPSAAVTLSNSKTGISIKQTTDSKGSYRFSNVPPGNGYKATFAHTGFATYIVQNVSLQVGITRTQDAKLMAGENQQVEVSATNSAQTLNTTDASIGNNIDVQQLDELPVQDRTSGITTLFKEQAGVDSVSDSVTGARTDQTEVTVDGLDVNDIAAGTAFGTVAQAPVDSVSQFTGTVAGLNSSIGTGSGGQFQLVTKSGTNSFHGNINEYHRDTTTVANSWFNNHAGVPRTPLIRNQFGGNIGGPIKRDKLFFFFDIADSRIIQSSTAERIVPLDSFRNGVFNYINNGEGCDGSATLSTAPQCISQADLTTLDPTGAGFNQDLLSFINTRYPHANDLTQGDDINTGGFRFTTPTPDIEATYVTRIDYNLTAAHRIWGRFTIQHRNATETLPEFPTDPMTHPFTDHSYGYVAGDTWTINQHMVNQFSYGDNISKFGFPDIYNPTGAAQYSFSGIDGPYTGFDGQQRRVPIPVVRDDFSWQHGGHTITIGGTFKFMKTNSNLINNFNFVEAGQQGGLANGLDASVRPADINTAADGVAITDYDSLFPTALGIIGGISTNFNYSNSGNPLPAGSGGPRAYRFFETEAYASDTWKVSPKLTLSYGLRYQLYSVPYEAHGEESVPVDSVTGKPITFNQYIADRQAQIAANNTSPNGLPFYKIVLGGKANNGPNLYAPSYKDLAPRLAFAYSATPRTVVHGAAGIVYDRTVINAINFLQDQISYLFSNTINQNFSSDNTKDTIATNPRLGSGLAYDSSLNPVGSPIAPGLIPFVDSNGNPYGLAEGNTNFVISPNLKDPYSIALDFGIEQQFPGHMILKLNYVGRLGRRLLADGDAGQVIDYPDKASGQTMGQAFAAITTEERAGQAVTAQPWFEDVLGQGVGQEFGFDNNTQLVAAIGGTDVKHGDIADTLYFMANETYGTGFLPNNVGIPSQFGANAYLTNQGNSNYHGMLVTLTKNISQGLRFDFNYTWSHSIDNTSEPANGNALFVNQGFICDVLNPRACRGDSDFDVRQEINSNFYYELPIGHGKQFLGAAPRWADEMIGGWTFSGLPGYRTGVAITAFSNAYLASFDNNDPAVFHGDKSDLRVDINQQNNVVWAFKGGQAGANKVFSEFSGPVGIQYGQRNMLRGPGAITFDAGLGKAFPVIENKVNLQFRADAFNVLNHPAFSGENVNILGNGAKFGQITGTSVSPRVAQFSLRLDF